MLMLDIDIFMVTETQLDYSFPVSQFNIEYSAHHLDEIEIKTAEALFYVFIATLWIQN